MRWLAFALAFLFSMAAMDFFVLTIGPVMATDFKSAKQTDKQEAISKPNAKPVVELPPTSVSVNRTETGSLMSKLKLSEGDVIESVNYINALTPQEAKDLLNKAAETKTEFPVKVVRKGSVQIVNVQVH